MREFELLTTLHNTEMTEEAIGKALKDSLGLDLFSGGYTLKQAIDEGFIEKDKEDVNVYCIRL